MFELKPWLRITSFPWCLIFFLINGPVWVILTANIENVKGAEFFAPQTEEPTKRTKINNYFSLDLCVSLSLLNLSKECDHGHCPHFPLLETLPMLFKQIALCFVEISPFQVTRILHDHVPMEQLSKPRCITSAPKNLAFLTLGRHYMLQCPPDKYSTGKSALPISGTALLICMLVLFISSLAAPWLCVSLMCHWLLSSVLILEVCQDLQSYLSGHTTWMWHTKSFIKK